MYEDDNLSGSRADSNSNNDPDDTPDPGSSNGMSPSGKENLDCTYDATDPPTDNMQGETAVKTGITVKIRP